MVKSDSQIDYLAIGHVCLDMTPSGHVPGGGVTFGARVARVLGCRTAVLTSAARDYNFKKVLRDVEVKCIPAGQTTIFENTYIENDRKQILHAVAGNLAPANIPPAWRNPAIVHITPLANEVDPEIIHAFSSSLIGLAPQGWLRCWDDGGRVKACNWSNASSFFPLADAVILSEEDLPDSDLLNEYRQWARLLVLTQGAAGCTLFYGEEGRKVSAPEVKEVEPTGAGDIFTAAFLIRFHRNGRDPLDAAEFANQIAARSVTQPDLESKIANLNAAVDD